MGLAFITKHWGIWQEPTSEELGMVFCAALNDSRSTLHAWLTRSPSLRTRGRRDGWHQGPLASFKAVDWTCGTRRDWLCRKRNGRGGAGEDQAAISSVSAGRERIGMPTQTPRPEPQASGLLAAYHRAAEIHVVGLCHDAIRAYLTAKPSIIPIENLSELGAVGVLSFFVQRGSGAIGDKPRDRSSSATGMQPAMIQLSLETASRSIQHQSRLRLSPWLRGDMNSGSKS